MKNFTKIVVFGLAGITVFIAGTAFGQSKKGKNLGENILGKVNGLKESVSEKFNKKKLFFLR